MKIRDRIKELRRVKASTLIPHEKNWRTHPPEQADAMRGMLAEIGYADALLAYETKEGLKLVDGHLRAEITPDQEVPVLVLDLTEEEANKMLVLFDPLTNLAGINDEALKELAATVDSDNDALKALIESAAADGDFSLMGAAPGEAVQDEIPPVPINPVSERGDVYLLGTHRLMCGDSTSADDVTRLLGGAKPFIMVTDPPYGVEYTPDWRDSALQDGADRRTGEVQNDDRIDWTEAYSLFSGSVAYVWHAGRFTGEIVINLYNAGYEIRSQIIWKKPAFAISRGHYHWQHEPCWYSVKKGSKAKWCGDRSQSTIWEISNRLADDEKTDHGTQKPVECMARPIRNHGDKTDDVYDPFVGSGTTIIAAEQMDRRCFAMEIDPAYVDVCVKRWENLTGAKAKRVKR